MERPNDKPEVPSTVLSEADIQALEADFSMINSKNVVESIYEHADFPHKSIVETIPIEQILHDFAMRATVMGKLKIALGLLLTSAELEFKKYGEPYSVTCLKLGKIFRFMHDNDRALRYFALAISIKARDVQFGIHDDVNGIIENAHQEIRTLCQGTN